MSYTYSSYHITTALIILLLLLLFFTLTLVLFLTLLVFMVTLTLSPFFTRFFTSHVSTFIFLLFYSFKLSIFADKKSRMKKTITGKNRTFCFECEMNEKHPFSSEFVVFFRRCTWTWEEGKRVRTYCSIWTVYWICGQCPLHFLSVMVFFSLSFFTVWWTLNWMMFVFDFFLVLL